MVPYVYFSTSDDFRDQLMCTIFQPLDYQHSPYMIDAGISVSERPIEVDARELPAPRIIYGNGQMVWFLAYIPPRRR